MLKDIGNGCSREDKELDRREVPGIYSFWVEKHSKKKKKSISWVKP